MTQFRLTKKFATDYKLTQLAEPQQTLGLLDDWVIDVMRIARKKVAIITHTKTFFTLLVPYSAVGGAKNVIAVIPAVLRNLTLSAADAMCIEQQFKTPALWCKTQNRQLLGHMNDFKQCIDAQTYGATFAEIDWIELTNYTNTIIINLRSVGMTRPIELMHDLLTQLSSVGVH